VIALALAASAAICPDTVLAGAKYQGDVISILAERGVAILAGDRSSQRYLAKDAEFSLVIGDVGDVIGRGADGAKALSARIAASKYEYGVWASIPMPAEPCGGQKVEVRFFDKSDERGVAVTFEYEDGQLVRASGWTIGRLVRPFHEARQAND